MRRGSEMLLIDAVSSWHLKQPQPWTTRGGRNHFCCVVRRQLNSGLIAVVMVVVVVVVIAFIAFLWFVSGRSSASASAS